MFCSPSHVKQAKEIPLKTSSFSGEAIFVSYAIAVRSGDMSWTYPLLRVKATSGDFRGNRGTESLEVGGMEVFWSGLWDQGVYPTTSVIQVGIPCLNGGGSLWEALLLYHEVVISHSPVFGRCFVFVANRGSRFARPQEELQRKDKEEKKPGHSGKRVQVLCPEVKRIGLLIVGKRVAVCADTVEVAMLPEPDATTSWQVFAFRVVMVMGVKLQTRSRQCLAHAPACRRELLKDIDERMEKAPTSLWGVGLALSSPKTGLELLQQWCMSFRLEAC